MPAVPKTTALQQIIFIGQEGSDAGGFRIVPDGKGGWKIEKVPGWNPEGMSEVGAALQVLGRAAVLKNARVSKSILKSAANLANEELEAGGVKAATIVVIGG